MFSNLTSKELGLFKKLSTPQKIQDYLDSLTINFEKKGETLYSPRMVIQKKTAHCMEGALFAAAVLWFHGARPLLLDLKTTKDDFEHVVALFRQHGRWGAISKTNHATIRYREPVYRSFHELAMSYFHEYFPNTGKKVMRSYSAPFDLRRYKDRSWITNEEDLWFISRDLDRVKHFPILPRGIKLRKADQIEIEAGKLREWGA